MAKSPESSDILRWKKGNSPVTYVLPNSEVRPEVICAEESQVSEQITIHRVYEALIDHIFRGDNRIVSLERDSARRIEGRAHIRYELWKAPHLPPLSRHTKYVFRTDTRTSFPLYVCAPVQITIERGANASAGAWLPKGVKAGGGMGRSTTLNMQVSAPVDPYLSFEIFTANEKDQGLYDLVHRYATELSGKDSPNAGEIAEYILKRYENYMLPNGGIVRAITPKPRTLEEGQSVNIPLQFTPIRSGRTLAVVCATNESGEQVFSDFIGLYCDTEAQTVVREF